MRTCATWRPGRVATGATRISRDWRRDASRHRWVRSPSDNCHSTCSKQAKGSLSLCLSQSSTKLALQIPFGLLNSPAGSSAEFPQIVLQSVCRFRVIFERRLLLSRCPSNLCAGSAFSPAAGQLQVRSCTWKKANRKWTKINYGPLRKPHVDLALLLPVGLSSGQRCVNYFCQAMLPYFLLLPSVKVLANWSSLILLRVSRF